MPKLNKQLVEKAAKSKKPCILWDDELKGFGLRISPKGKGSWLIKRRLGKGGTDAKQIKYVLGTYPTIDLEAAYTEALKIVAAINEGINPQNVKRRVKNKQHADYANGKLKDVYALWFAKHQKDADIKGSYWHQVKRRFDVEIVPKLKGETLLADITKRDITQLIDNKEKQTQSGARQVFNALSPFFKWCVSREIVTVNPMAGLSPPERYEDRDRVLNDQELLAVWHAASATSYPWGPFYKLLLLTAQRRDEVATMEWSELDLSKRHEWIIPGAKTKNGKEHLVHLSPWAVDILHGIAHGNSTPQRGSSIAEKAGDKYVFTTVAKLVAGKPTEVPISGFSKAKSTIDAKIKAEYSQALEPWRVHDLRRTAATGMAGLGVPPYVVERILNHISGPEVGGLTGIYQRFEYVEERRKAITDWSNHINDLLIAESERERAEQQASNVVAFRG